MSAKTWDVPPVYQVFPAVRIEKTGKLVGRPRFSLDIVLFQAFLCATLR